MSAAASRSPRQPRSSSAGPALPPGSAHRARLAGGGGGGSERGDRLPRGLTAAPPPLRGEAGGGMCRAMPGSGAGGRRGRGGSGRRGATCLRGRWQAARPGLGAGAAAGYGESPAPVGRREAPGGCKRARPARLGNIGGAFRQRGKGRPRRGRRAVSGVGKGRCVAGAGLEAAGLALGPSGAGALPPCTPGGHWPGPGAEQRITE